MIFCGQFIFRPKVLSNDIPARQNEVYIFYNPPISFKYVGSRKTSGERLCE